MRQFLGAEPNIGPPVRHVHTKLVDRTGRRDGESEAYNRFHALYGTRSPRDPGGAKSTVSDGLTRASGTLCKGVEELARYSSLPMSISDGAGPPPGGGGAGFRGSREGRGQGRSSARARKRRVASSRGA